ncbi:MAG TPA: hypothetical protein VGI75_04075, partial [Pirellulales bacterium]
MSVLFFILGFALGYLIGPVAGKLAAWLGHPVKKQFFWWCGAVVWLLIFGFGLTVLYAQYYDYWTWWPVRHEQFFEQTYSKAIFALLAGFALFAGRKRIVAAVDSLFTNPPAVLQNPWVTAAVGIGVSAVVVVALLAILSPDTLFRLESVKVGEVEAKFAAASEQTLRTYNQSDVHDSNNILGVWAGIDQKLTATVQPIEDLLTSPEQRERAHAKHQHAAEFLKKVAKPLALAMRCFTNEFRVRDTNIQNDAVLLANDWANFVRQLAQSASGEEATDQSLAWKFIGFVAESDTLTKAIDVILRKRDSVCGGGSASSWKGVVIEQYDPRDLVVFPRETLIDIFSDGYVLQFIADLVALTHDADRAASFYTEITDKKFLDTAVDAKPAELNFYFRRATSKYRANWYPRDAADDFDHAFKLSNEILDAIAASNTKNKDAMKSYYESLRAAILNNKIYNLVSDWLEGRPLDADKITTLEEAANELRKWVGAQSMTEILDPHMQGRFYSTTLVSA